MQACQIYLCAQIKNRLQKAPHTKVFSNPGEGDHQILLNGFDHVKEGTSVTPKPTNFLPKSQVTSFDLIKVDLWTTNVLNVFAGGYVSVDKEKPIKQNQHQQTQGVTRMSVFCGLAALLVLSGSHLSHAASVLKPKVGLTCFELSSNKFTGM